MHHLLADKIAKNLAATHTEALRLKALTKPEDTRQHQLTARELSVNDCDEREDGEVCDAICDITTAQREHGICSLRRAQQIWRCCCSPC